ncbi:MAG: UvrABC system protein C [Dehalococcoidia bacterium]|nr:UvrABC system protein C [Chloroflexota bacterium]
MVSRVADIDFIVTDSEQEALILECNLIKKHRPYYNVRLKDDKSYPYLKITLAEEWPGVQLTRRLIEDGSRYFGPFAGPGSLRRTMNLVNKLFAYRTCKRIITGTDTRPCLKYHLSRCAGPCVGAVNREEYHAIITQLILFLGGKQDKVVRELRKKMSATASNLEFEKAASLRDQIQAIESIIEEQKVVSTSRINEDVIAIARDKNEACAQVFFIRGGRLLGKENFVLDGVQDENLDQIMTGFVEQFYSSGASIPPQILLQTEVKNRSLIEGWLGSKCGRRVHLVVPRRGERKKLVDLVAQNASESLEQSRIKWLTDSGKTALGELKDLLRLPRVPRRIECYDISNIQGVAAVGSMVVFEDGQPRPSHYRRFRIKTVAGIDDYAMMQEVLRRRFARKAGEQETGASWASTPDLVLIDGGWGHLNAALEIIRESVPVASIAKENEEIFGSTGLVTFPRNSPALYLLQRVRDESHRFALSYHLKVRGKGALTSELDEVPGIGPKRRQALLKRFGTLREIRAASLDELASVPGITRSLAAKVKER